ncbi:MAG: hypothetical protein EA351_00680 [Gemmatimonadales bacterium]|nr:MAG: hypothetical protein EA351_00680 [Gemmatimonadales bacterium]
MKTSVRPGIVAPGWVIAIAFLSAAGPQSVQAQELVIHEVAQTKGSQQAPFGTINDMLEIDDGRILVSDDVVGIVHAWNVERGAVVRFARGGQGPGEVTVPSRMAARPGGGFGIYDIGASALLLFDAQAMPERVVRTEGGIVSNPKSLAILRDGSFLVAGGRLTDPRHLHHYDGTGRYLGSYGDPSPFLQERTPLIQSAGGALRAHPEGGFLLSYGAPLRIKRFPRDSFDAPELIAEDVAVLPELREEEVYVESDRSPGPTVFRWWHDRSTGVTTLPDGRILNVITRFYSGDSIWDVYSPDGSLEVRKVVETAFYLYGTTRDGRVLASYRDPDTDEHVAVVLEIEILK